MVINGRILADSSTDRYSPRYQMRGDGTALRYFGVPEEGVDLWFTVAGDAPATLRVITGVEGLPAGASGPISVRPSDRMSKPFIETDMTITKWTVRI